MTTMITPVEPAKALEIENKFRGARTIGEFVDAATLATESMYPTDPNDSRTAALRKLNKDINAAIVAALGGRDFPLRQVPDVFMLIEDHAGLTGSVSGLLLRQQEELAKAAKNQGKGN